MDGLRRPNDMFWFVAGLQRRWHSCRTSLVLMTTFNPIVKEIWGATDGDQHEGNR